MVRGVLGVDIGRGGRSGWGYAFFLGCLVYILMFEWKFRSYEGVKWDKSIGYYVL